MKRWLIRGSVLLILVAAVVVLRATVWAPKPIPVQVVEVSSGRVEAAVTNTRAGTVKARRRARLSPQVGGRVVAIPHPEGSRVEAGAVLLELDVGVPQRELDLSRRELAAVRAQRDQTCLAADRAVRERDRLARLAAEGIISPDNLDAATTAADTGAAACKAAQAAISSAEGGVALSQARQELYQLRAPFGGILAEVMTEIGEWATPSPPAVPVPPVVDLIDPASMYVSAPMDEVDAGRLRAGLPARVSVDARPGESFDGTVVRVAPYVEDVEAQNRTVEIEVELSDAALAATLLPGTSADVEVVLEAREGALRVPTSALLDGQRVLLIGADGRLEERRLEIGLRNWDWAEVRSGLTAGERIVISLDRPGVVAGARVVTEAPSE